MAKVTHRNKRGKLVRTSGTIIGRQQTDLYHLYLSRLTREADRVCLDKTHPLSGEFNIRTNQAKNSFLPLEITQLNKAWAGM